MGNLVPKHRREIDIDMDWRDIMMVGSRIINARDALERSIPAGWSLDVNLMNSIYFGPSDEKYMSTKVHKVWVWRYVKGWVYKQPVLMHNKRWFVRPRGLNDALKLAHKRSKAVRVDRLGQVHPAQYGAL